MKKTIRIFTCSVLAFLMLGLMSCEDYLDQEPDSILNEETAFRSFVNFQSFTEELYHLIPDLTKHHWTSDWNWGEEIITSLEGERTASVHIDNGNYTALLGLQSCFLDRPSANNGSWNDADPIRQKSMWAPFWYGINKANLGLANLHRLTDATQEEKDLIKGQLLFFRGFFHFQLIQYWGPLPFIGEVLSAVKPLRLPRPTYHEVADLIANDFRNAADLLPFHWNNTVAGQRSAFNRYRINKIMALGYLSKNYLWAASPLMNRQSTGNSAYHAEYAMKSAAAAAELLKHVDSGATDVQLASWEKITDLFYTVHRDWLIPGQPEAIFQAPNYHAQSTNWHNSRVFAPAGILGRELPVYTPTANYVNYYGMANGLPLDHPDSGFDPEYPWRGRDPRFYKDFIFDGVRTIRDPIPPAIERFRYASLHSGGLYRNPESGSRTGYLVYKWIPIFENRYDITGWNVLGNLLTIQHCYMRLADVYLMYAEAAAIGNGSSAGKDPDFHLTATDAVNVIRNRSGVGDLAAGLEMDIFMSELRRERAVELSFEGHRFTDLRRWLLLTKSPYNIKTSQEFDRVGELDLENPQNNRVANFREMVILQRQFSDKHYWIPFRISDVTIYEGFHQNPGW